MNKQLLRQSPSPAAVGTLATLVFGCLVGAFVVAITNHDIRWVTALAVVTVFVCGVLVMARRQRFLWAVFILSFQLLDPSIRVLYGYADTDGLVLTLSFLIGLFILLVYAVSGRFSGDHQLRLGGPFLLPIGLLFFTSVISFIHSKETFLGISALLMQCELYLMYFIALNCVRSEEALRLTLKWLFVALAIQSVIYYAESALGIYYVSPLGEVVTALEGDLTRPGGTISRGPFGFANFVLLIMFVLIADFMPMRSSGTIPRWHKGILIIMGVVALVLTLSRSAWGSFILGGAWLVITAYRRQILSYRKLLYIVVVAVLVAMAATPLIVLRLEGAPLESSYDERFALMQMAINVIVNNPLFGVGPGAYDVTYKNYLSPELAEKWLWTVHNYYLLWTAERGIPSGLAWILLLLMGVRHSLKLSRSSILAVRTLALGCGAGIVAVSHQMYWDMWTHVPAQSLFWFLLGLLAAGESIEGRSKREQRLASGWISGVEPRPTKPEPKNGKDLEPQSTQRAQRKTESILCETLCSQ